MGSECNHRWGDPYRSKNPDYPHLLFRDCKACGAIYYNDETGASPSGIMQPMVRLALYSTPPAPAMPDAKMFPLQAGYRDAKSAPHPLQIPWSVAEKAYCAYARRYGRRQSLERLAERGGFDGAEMDDLYPPWRDEVSELTTLRQRLAEAEARAEDFKRIGQGFERDMRKHFQQSCDNLRRAEEAEADAARWEGAARVLAEAVEAHDMYERATVRKGVVNRKIAARTAIDANETASALVREGGGAAALIAAKEQEMKK